MGWIVSVICFIGFAMTGEPMVLIASGLFAIAGAISFVSINKK